MPTVTIQISDTDEPGIPFRVKVTRDNPESAELDKPTPAERVARRIESTLASVLIERAVKLYTKNKKPTTKKPLRKRSSRRNP
jgi:hypothetical protein